MQSPTVCDGRLIVFWATDDRDGIFCFQNSFHVIRFRSGEWLNDITRVDEFMDVLSRMSNSNEQFEVNVTFQIECLLLYRGLSTPLKTKLGERY